MKKIFGFVLVSLMAIACSFASVKVLNNSETEIMSADVLGLSNAKFAAGLSADNFEEMRNTLIKNYGVRNFVKSGEIDTARKSSSAAVAFETFVVGNPAWYIYVDNTTTGKTEIYYAN